MNAVPSNCSPTSSWPAASAVRNRPSRNTATGTPSWPTRSATSSKLLLMVEDLKPGSDDASGSSDGSAPSVGKRLEQIGDYRILCEVGRGGMGVVYEAEQQTLGRRVALKVLPSAGAGEGSAQVRFQREARAAARMHHTNIVPVFDVGQDGEHLYYAMQLIHGQGLDLVIDDLKRLRARARPRRAERAADRSIAASLVTGRFERENLAAEGTDGSDVTAAYEGSAPSSAVLPGQSEMSTVTQQPGGLFPQRRSDRPADGLGVVVCRTPGDHPPRHQAGEPDPRHGRQRLGDRFRSGQDRRRRHDPHRRHPGYDPLHVAGAVSRPVRRPRRRLCPWA